MKPAGALRLESHNKPEVSEDASPGRNKFIVVHSKQGEAASSRGASFFKQWMSILPPCARLGVLTACEAASSACRQREGSWTREPLACCGQERCLMGQWAGTGRRLDLTGGS